MNIKKWLSTAVASMLLATAIQLPASAQEKRTIQDESIYDVLVDRYFNKTSKNDYETDPDDPSSFAGGDFGGLQEKFNYIYDMGYTIISLGTIFSTDKYDGSLPTSHTTLERRFGTEEELDELIKTYKKYDIRMMADFPLGQASINHEWANDPKWIASTEGNMVKWDLTNKALQQKMIEAATTFVKAHDIAGLRITYLEDAPQDFLNDLIAAVKAEGDYYVIAKGESDADFDTTYSEETNQIFREAFKNVNGDTSTIPAIVNSDKPMQLMVDELDTSRFTHDIAGEGMFAPTRMRMVLGTLFTLPGTPVVQYGTEIAINGEQAPDTHQVMNFSVDKELQGNLRNVMQLRNDSPTLRNGDFNVIENDNGLLVYTRTSDDEQWVIFVNNTDKTKSVTLTEEQLGANKELRGMFDRDIVREQNGEYVLVLNREIVEIYQVIENQGLNKSYMVALALVYILFAAFIIIVVKRARQGKKRNA
ncbi:alpha-amylase family glycosyl hydrolase [Metalysinibacillus jejuensis]|uniref:alpha-amylase family glycosyl hydrolase n=1 Tax=Metalysinibacillus jejuensis TaxID=914327 RepID=UPI000D33D0C7|nr:alpha-amylase family glycosyl hydrolase [Metalysinibacillus jejuensis]